MKNILSVFALAAAGAFVASAGASAAQADSASLYRQAALAGPLFSGGLADASKDVIEPPSSIDPGMTLDPPETGAKMPIVHPPGSPMPGGHLILPH